MVLMAMFWIFTDVRLTDGGGWVASLPGPLTQSLLSSDLSPLDLYPPASVLRPPASGSQGITSGRPHTCSGDPQSVRAMTRRRDPLPPQIVASTRALAARLDGLSKLVAIVDASFARERDRADSLEARVARLEQTPTADPRHVPAEVAAARLGVDVRTVRRWIEGQRLLGRALRVPGSRRRRWVVNAVALDRLLAPGSPAAPAARDDGSASAAAKHAKG